MDAACSIFAIDAKRFAGLCSDENAVTDEVILREELRYLAFQARTNPGKSETELLAQMRARRNPMAIENPLERSVTLSLYARIDGLIDNALARGDRRMPFEFENDWYKLNEILTYGEEPESAAHFLLGGKQIGEDAGYGSPWLQAPSAVTGFAAHLDRWSPEHFLAVLDLLARSEEDYIGGFNALFSADQPADPTADAQVDEEFRQSEALFFTRFKSYIANAAAAECGMLIWMG